MKTIEKISKKEADYIKDVKIWLKGFRHKSTYEDFVYCLKKEGHGVKRKFEDLGLERSRAEYALLDMYKIYLDECLLIMQGQLSDLLTDYGVPESVISFERASFPLSEGERPFRYLWHADTHDHALEIAPIFTKIENIFGSYSARRSIQKGARNRIWLREELQGPLYRAHPLLTNGEEIPFVENNKQKKSHNETELSMQETKNIEEERLDWFVGQTVKFICQGENRLVFVCESGKEFEMFHLDDCCEEVNLVDITGDLIDLLGSQIIKAEKVFSGEKDCLAWTYYKFATTKGYVTIRWYGESNGYYSVDVDFIERPSWKRSLSEKGVCL